jgi:hypothetical protein
MAERTQTSSRRRGALAPEVRALVERAARVEHGRALLHLAPPECAAVLLGERPPAVERVRAALEDRRTRDAALALFARALGSRPPRAPRSAAPPLPTPRRAEEVLRDAQARPDGLAVLLSAAAECGAITFGVHPEVVLAARALARSRGLAGAAAEP